MSLSERIRPNVEAAPWVIEAVKSMEARLKTIEIKAEAGLCYYTLESAREFLKDIRDEVASALGNARPPR